MKDLISAERLELLHPTAKNTFKQFITEAEIGLNIVLRISQGLRTFDEQNALFVLGRTKPGKIVTQACGGMSWHNYALAIDLVQVIGSDINWNFDYKLLLPYAAKYNIEAGQNWHSFQDKPHFQITFGLNIHQALDRYTKKDFIKGTEYIRV